MTMGVTEEAGKVGAVAVEAMKSTPLAIALLIVNVGFLAFSGYVLGQVAGNAQERNRTQMELIKSLAEDLRDCTTYKPRPQSYLPEKSIVFTPRPPQPPQEK